MTQGLASVSSIAATARQGRLAATRLTLTNFRNYTNARFDTDGMSVVLTGDNGAGKTNFLEAISFLVPGSGLRGAKLSDVASINGKPLAGEAFVRWGVAANLQGSSVETIGTGLEKIPTSAVRAKRAVHVDGQAVRTQSQLAEHFSCHWLTPQMDRLFQGGSDGRRRFLDRLVFSMDPAHAGRTSAYMHAMRERARLLKDGKMDDAWLSALEETMAAKGVAVAAARMDVAKRLGDFCENHDGAFPAAHLVIDGMVENLLENNPALQVEERIKDVLKTSRISDGQKGATGSAAEGRLSHQSDLVVTHLSKSAPAAMCSTGEQKMLLTGLVLGAARLSALDEGRIPVLLLDEVCAHLDEHHLGALFDEVFDIGAQSWFTGTDANLFVGLKGRARFAAVDGGNITISE
ncbi:MAG: DNA replication/repair protein RecF [Rhodospirillaceae bacterium]|nr:DNA replication/repair protein RecF [Rhodospirillaceae bacterium]